MSEPVYPRDLIGYGANTPHPQWPNGARLALQIVLNYEEGAESSVLHGDAASETFCPRLSALRPLPAYATRAWNPSMNMAARAGLWRLLRMFREHDIKVTVFAVAMALQRNPEAVRAMLEDGHEIASHGWRWINYQFVDEETERTHVKLAVDTLIALTGSPPLGWYTGRDSPNTRRLVVEHGGFLYDADSYADDLPYWELVNGKPHLVVPYTLDANDMRFCHQPGLQYRRISFSHTSRMHSTCYTVKGWRRRK